MFLPPAFPSGAFVGIAVAKITFCYQERSFLFTSESQITTTQDKTLVHSII